MSLLWAGLVVVVVTALAITAMLLVRRRAPAGSHFEDGDRAAGVFGVLATGFAVLLGFVVFLAFESYDTSRSGAETEAQIVDAAVRDGAVLPGRRSCAPLGRTRLLRADGDPPGVAEDGGGHPRRHQSIHGASPRSARSRPSSRSLPPSRRRTRNGSTSAPTARMRAPTVPTAPRG